MKILLLIFFIGFISCNENRPTKADAQIDVIDTEMAPVIKLDNVLTKIDSIKLMSYWSKFKAAIFQKDTNFLKTNMRTNALAICDMDCWESISDTATALEGIISIISKGENAKEVHATASMPPRISANYAYIDSNGKKVLDKEQIVFSIFCMVNGTVDGIRVARQYSYNFIKNKKNFQFSEYNFSESCYKDKFKIGFDVSKLYFPLNTNQRGEKETNCTLDSSVNRWYSENFSILKQPFIYGYNGADEQYRFTWLRSDGRYAAITVQQKDGNYELKSSYIVAYNKGEYQTSDTIFSINYFKWLKIKWKISNTTNFWEMPCIDAEPRGSDGEQWIFEGYKDHQYHFVDRWMPTDNDFKKLCLYFIELSGIQLPSQY